MALEMDTENMTCQGRMADWTSWNCHWSKDKGSEGQPRDQGSRLDTHLMKIVSRHVRTINNQKKDRPPSGKRAEELSRHLTRDEQLAMAQDGTMVMQQQAAGPLHSVQPGRCAPVAGQRSHPAAGDLASLAVHSQNPTEALIRPPGSLLCSPHPGPGPMPCKPLLSGAPVQLCARPHCTVA